MMRLDYLHAVERSPGQALHIVRGRPQGMGHA
jgi:hypothetical protein